MTRSRSSDSRSAFWWAVARLVKGKAARLRASRIRLEITISDSGPLPRNHSPPVLLRLSRFIRAFLLSNQIPKASGLFVQFRIDRLSKFFSKFNQFSLSSRRGSMPGHLADMLARAMNSLQERLQAGAEHGIIVGAAQPTFSTKLHVLDAAERARESSPVVCELPDVMPNQGLQDRGQV